MVSKISWYSLEFSGSGVDEIATVIEINSDRAINVKVGQVILRIDERYFRPAEVDTLLGDPSKAKQVLGWEPEITAKEMCEEMINEDYKSALRYRLLKDNGLEIPISTKSND